MQVMVGSANFRQLLMTQFTKNHLSHHLILNICSKTSHYIYHNISMNFLIHLLCIATHTQGIQHHLHPLMNSNQFPLYDSFLFSLLAFSFSFSFCCFFLALSAILIIFFSAATAFMASFTFNSSRISGSVIQTVLLLRARFLCDFVGFGLSKTNRSLTASANDKFSDLDFSEPEAGRVPISGW